MSPPYLNFSNLINFCRLVLTLKMRGGAVLPNHNQSFDCPQALNAGMVGIKQKV